jgi:hypothetical protein
LVLALRCVEIIRSETRKNGRLPRTVDLAEIGHSPSRLRVNNAVPLRMSLSAGGLALL